MGKSDQQLLAQASLGGRNLIMLGILAAIGAVVLGIVSRTTGNPQGQKAILMGAGAVAAITFACWFLGAAASRGSANALGIAVLVLVTQIPLTVVLTAVAGVNSDSAAASDYKRLVIPVAALLVLVSNRSTIIELKKRGLWEKAFPDAKSTTGLCIIGGALLIGGFISVHALVWKTIGEEQEAAEQTEVKASQFLALGNMDEKVFTDR